MKKLFVTDLDGTALGGDYPVYAQFPPCFGQLLDALWDGGWGWALDTTWDVAGQWKLVQESPVTSRPSYLIGEIGRTVATPGPEGLELWQPWVSDQDRRVDEFVRRKILPLLGVLNQEFTPRCIHCWGHLFQYICRDQDMPRLQELRRKLLEDPEMIVMDKKSRELVIRPAFLSKGAPLREIMSREGLSPDDVYVAGDEETDLWMMSPEITSHPLCPSNASASVKSYVREHGGEVATLPYGMGIVQLMEKYL